MEDHPTPFSDKPRIACLDHGFVRLVDSMGSDLSVVRAARVSYDEEWRAGLEEKSDTRLIRYMLAHRHGTPFEAVTFTFEVMAPIFVVRQWHRHRTQSYNELSARYRELPEVYYVPRVENVTSQSTTNHQGRTTQQIQQAATAQRLIQAQSEECFKAYHSLLAMGTPRELARMVLPLNTYTHMFCTLNLRNLMGFLLDRMDSHAQWEIRQYANAMFILAKAVTPVTLESWATGKGFEALV